jgi:hypothetical protein
MVLMCFRNSTTLLSPPPDTFWGQFEDISKYNVHLNIAERLWVAWYAYMQNDVLATGIMSFVMHEIVYFGRSLPWIIIDSLGLFKKYKIQGASNATSSAASIYADQTRRTRCHRHRSNGLVRSLFFLVILPWSCLKYGK